MTLNRPTKPLFRFRCKQNSGLEQCRKAILPHSFFYWRCYVTFGRMFIYLPLFCVHFILPKFTRSSNHLEMDHAQRTLNKVMFNNKISYFSAWSGHCLSFYLFLWGLPLRPYLWELYWKRDILRKLQWQFLSMYFAIKSFQVAQIISHLFGVNSFRLAAASVLHRVGLFLIESIHFCAHMVHSIL